MEPQIWQYVKPVQYVASINYELSHSGTEAIFSTVEMKRKLNYECHLVESSTPAQASSKSERWTLRLNIISLTLDSVPLPGAW